jgi:protein subunit release factor A
MQAEAFRVEGENLRQKNKDLEEKIERLQAYRCSDAEELVYLKWINACLRYELRNYQPRDVKTVARDLSKTLSPKSEEKAKQLILEYANTEGVGEKGIHIMDFDYEDWSYSHASKQLRLSVK